MGAIYHAGSKYGGIGFDSFASVDDGTLLHTFSNGGATSGGAWEIWQATDDCFITGQLIYMRSRTGSNQSLIRISSTESTSTGLMTNGIKVADTYVNSESSTEVVYDGLCIPVKKGQYILVYAPYDMIDRVKVYKAKKSSPQQTDKAYNIDDAAETTIDDADYFPFYDTSESAKRKSLWSNIKKELYKTLCPAGTRSLGGVLMQSGSVYQIIIYLPIPANKVSISCDEFRPGGQTSVKVTNPTINANNGNELVIYTTNSSFASFVGKEAVAHLTFEYS